MVYNSVHAAGGFFAGFVESRVPVLCVTVLTKFKSLFREHPRVANAAGLIDVVKCLWAAFKKMIFKKVHRQEVANIDLSGPGKPCRIKYLG